MKTKISLRTGWGTAVILAGLIKSPIRIAMKTAMKVSLTLGVALLAAKPIWADWVTLMKSKGLDGQTALDQIQQAIAKNK